jgi:hypothetical protein
MRDDDDLDGGGPAVRDRVERREAVGEATIEFGGKPRSRTRANWSANSSVSDIARSPLTSAPAP